MSLLLLAVLLSGSLLFVASIFKGMGTHVFINADALIIIFSGTIIALCIGFPFQRLLHAMHDIFDTFKRPASREVLIKNIIEAARHYRMADIRSLEKMQNKIDDDFFRLGLNLLINNHHSEDIRDIMQREMAIKTVNYHFTQNVLKTVARITPSLGLAGTVISLIKMFGNLQSVDAITPLMAVALMSTFYGIILSNLVALPLCAKLKERAILSEIFMNTIIEGILAVHNREHPLKIEERLNVRTQGPKIPLQEYPNAIPLASSKT